MVLRAVDKKLCARVSHETFEKFRTAFPFYGETQAFLEMCIYAALDPEQKGKTIAELKQLAKDKARSAL